MRKLSLNTGTGMSRQSKTVPQAKKVLPPAVPDMYGKISHSNGNVMSMERNGVTVGSGGGSTMPQVTAGGLTTAVVYDTGDGALRNGGGGAMVVAGTVVLEHHNPTHLQSHHHHHHHQQQHERSTSGASVNAEGTTVANVAAANASAVETTVGSSATSGTAAPSSLLLRCGPECMPDYGLDDQGIDLTQSPGRDSPVSLSGSAGSGSRHSTASLDSGRASSYLTGASNSSNRSVSGVGSYGVLSSPRCSVSSCSIGSGSGGSSGIGGSVGGGAGGSCCGSHRLSNHSNRSDHDIISEWLMEVHFHEYTYLFLEAGYDLATIARMTPEDLTAIGIRKPNHRERLKRHIDALKLPDALPGYVPGSIDEWLRLLRLEEYVQPLLAQGYQTVHDVTQLTWEDLEDIGIVKLGHQKKILLAIKRVKDIISGKLMSGGFSGIPSYVSVGGVGGGGGSLGLSPTIVRTPGATVGVRAHYDDMGIGLRSDSSKQQQLHLAATGTYSTFLRQQPPLTSGTEAMHYAHQQQQQQLLSGLHHHPQQQQQQQHSHQMITYPHVHFDGTHAIYRRSSYDDSDITPTNEKTLAILPLSGGVELHGGLLPQHHQQQQWLQQHQQQLQLLQQQQQYFQGGGTLPRQHQRNNYGVRLALIGQNAPAVTTQRQRPIAKIVANNLKLPGGANVAGGGGPSAIDGPVDDDGGGGVFQSTLPAMLGHIENVEMATAALDAMHFSNFTNSPYAAAGHHASLKFNASGGSPSGGGPGVGNVSPATGMQQQQPIYHNQPILQQPQHSTSHHHPHHHHNHSSSQSTPSPPTLTGSAGQQLHPMVGYTGVGCFAGQTHQTTVEVHKVSSQHDNKSNSSLESIDQIPFANENAGTIKQRSSLHRVEHHIQQQQQSQQHNPVLLPPLSSSSSTSSSSSSSTGSITTTLATGCIQQATLSSPPGLLSSSAAGSMMVHSGSSASSVGLVLDATASSCLTQSTGSTSTVVPAIVAGSTGSSVQSDRDTSTAAPSDDIYGTNVLNDIGNMLANLTDELDAMLEEEKCAGISDIE